MTSWAKISLCAALSAVLSCAEKEAPSTEASSQAPAAQPNAAPSKKAESGASNRPDWSEFVGKGPCLLSVDEIKATLTLEGEVKVESGAGGCAITHDGSRLGMISVAEQSEESITKQDADKNEAIARSKERAEKIGEPLTSANLFSKVVLDDPTIPATWRGSHYSHVALSTKTHVIDVAVTAPEPPKTVGQAQYDATKDERDKAYRDRYERAVKLANALVAKATSR